MSAPLSPRSYRGVDISFDDGPLVQAIFSETGPNLLPVQYDQRFVPVAGRHPYPLSPQPLQKELLLDVRLDIPVDGTGGGEIAEFLGLFDGALGEQSFIATDGTIDWEIEASVLRLEHANGVLNRWMVTLQATDGVWRKSTDSLDLNTASAVTSLALVATALGNQRAPLIVEATPSVVKGQANDQIWGRQVVIAWRAPAAGLNYPITIQMDTATETTANMQADGDDIAVVVDNVIVQRDLGTMDAAVTNIWFVADWAPARSATLKAAMTAGSPATGADWDLGPLADTTALPDSGVLLIGTEAIHYSSKDPDGRTLLSITRGVRNTTAAIHAVDAEAFYVEHDIWLLYGYSAATPPTIDSDRTPQFDRTILSNNGQWTYNPTSGFATEAGRRPGEWVPLKYGTNARMVTVRGQKATATFIPLAGGTLSAGWTATGAASLREAVDDPVGTPDDDTSYISATLNNQNATFTPQSGGTLAGIPDDALIGSVMVTVRAKHSATGGSSVFAALYMPGEDLNPSFGPANALSAAYSNYSYTWTENIWSGLPWTMNDLKQLEIGVGSTGIGSGGIPRVTQVYLTVTYAPHADPATALGIYADSGEYQPGFPNRDAWQLDTPAGVLGSSGAALTVVSGGVVNDAALYGTDQFGQFQRIGRSFSGGTTHIHARPDFPLSSLLWHSPTVSTVQWAGSAMTDAVLQFDPDRIPSVVVGAAQSVYIHRWTLTQEDDQDNALTVLFVSPLNKKLTVDTDTGAVTFEDAGRLGLSALSLSTQRRDWLELLAGENDLTWSDPTNGAGVLAVNLRWRDRRI